MINAYWKATHVLCLRIWVAPLSLSLSRSHSPCAYRLARYTANSAYYLLPSTCKWNMAARPFLYIWYGTVQYVQYVKYVQYVQSVQIVGYVHYVQYERSSSTVCTDRTVSTICTYILPNITTMPNWFRNIVMCWPTRSFQKKVYRDSKNKRLRQPLLSRKRCLGMPIHIKMQSIYWLIFNIIPY